MKLGDTIFNGNAFKNIILNSKSYKRMILGTNLVWSYFGIAINAFRTRISADGGTYEAESILEDKLQEITPDLFDSASLVITPNGVKTSKLYSIKPNDGTGDLSVTRATTATRVNEQGLIEPVPYNLFSYSEDFGNSFWTKNNSTVTTNTNQTMSPIGTNTVDLYIPNTTFGEHQITTLFPSSTSLFINSTNIYNWSVYVKSAGNNFFLLRVNINDIWSSVVFNLSSSSIVSTHPNFISAKIESVNDGWQLLSCVITRVNGINVNVFQHISSPTGDIVFRGNGTSGAYIWGAQLTLGTSKRDYFATTDRLNVARIDYSTGQPAILVEPQRTNLVFPSDIATTQVRAVTAQAYTLSFYGTGSVVLSGAYTGNLNGTGANNRVSLTFTPTAGNLTLTVSGSVTNWQLEAGSNATSYIPTTNVSVTRNADVISKSGISSLIGQTEGTLYWEGFLYRNASNGRLIAVSQSGIVNRAVLNINNNRIELINRSNSTNGSGSISSSTLSEILNGLNKIAVGYQSENTVLYVNGILAGTSTQTFTYTELMSIINIVSSEVNQTNVNTAQTKLAIVYKNRLSNVQLQQLTTL